MPAPKTCQAVAQRTQKYCKRCGVVWDLDDRDPPTCLTSEDIAQRELAKMRAMLPAGDEDEVGKKAKA